MKLFLDLVTTTQNAVRTAEAEVRKEVNKQMVRAVDPFYSAPIVVKIGTDAYVAKSIYFGKDRYGEQTQLVIEAEEGMGSFGDKFVIPAPESEPDSVASDLPPAPEVPAPDSPPVPAPAEPAAELACAGIRATTG